MKELLGLHSIFLWMSENRTHWTFMEQDLLDSHTNATQPTQMRSDYQGRREGEGSLEHHAQSDSEGVQCINDSEDEDDEDSRFEEMETLSESPAQLVVEGAGHPDVNGVYARDGYFERACKYSKRGKYNGNESLFSLFQCNVSNNTKHWYISIVPPKGLPGTNADLDFYSAPVNENCTELPPRSGWTKANEGADPPPTITFSEGENDPAIPTPFGRNLVDQSVDEQPNGNRSFV